MINMNNLRDIALGTDDHPRMVSRRVYRIHGDGAFVLLDGDLKTLQAIGAATFSPTLVTVGMDGNALLYQRDGGLSVTLTKYGRMLIDGEDEDEDEDEDKELSSK